MGRFVSFCFVPFFCCSSNDSASYAYIAFVSFSSFFHSIKIKQCQSFSESVWCKSVKIDLVRSLCWCISFRLFLFIRIFRCGNLFSVLFTNQKRANKQKHIILCMKKKTIYMPILYFYIYNIHISYTYTFFIFISLRIHVICTLYHLLPPANPSVSFLFLHLALFLFSDSLCFLLIILF